MSKRTYLSSGLSVLAIGLTTALLINGQQPQKAESSMTQKEVEEMNKRGDKAMGFDHLKTTHHFILASDGGSIQGEANDEKDDRSRDKIQQHLQAIAMILHEGTFETPMLLH